MKITKNDLKKIIKEEISLHPDKDNSEKSKNAANVNVKSKIALARKAIDKLCADYSFFEETLIEAIAERCLDKGKDQSTYWTKLAEILNNASSNAQKESNDNF